MQADGSNLTQLTQPPGNNSQPTWSPDGSKIAFRSRRDVNSELYVMNADGSNPVRLTNNPAFDGEIPAWSPDGTRIAFHSDRDGDPEIFVMSADGSDVIQLTHNEAGDRNPSWSPDGTKLVFSSDRDGNRELYTMYADGSNPVRLTHNDAYDGYADWSPDGSKMVFISMRDEGWGGEIYSMNTDGSDQTRLTVSRGWDFDPAWSPDGSKIVFNSRRDGRRGIYVMNANGSNQIKLTNKVPSEFITVATQQGVAVALQRYRTARAQVPDMTFFLEAEVRALAYTLLDNQPDDALTLFTLNTEAFPQSSSAFLTLGDVHMQLQNKNLAIQAYQKALDLNPDSNLTLAQLRKAQAD